MPENKSNWLGYGFAVLATLIVGIGGYAWLIDTNDFSADDITQAKTEATTLALKDLESAKKTAFDSGVASVVIPPAADTTSLDEIKALISEDDDWETEAIALATEEWEDHSYKAIFEFINENGGCDNMVDRYDIDSVTIKDEDVSSHHFDADNQDAIVKQEVKVKYDGIDEAKVCRLEITTRITDGEIDDEFPEFKVVD